MKASLTNESSGVFFERADTIDQPTELVRDGLTMTPWHEGLPSWRAALGRFQGVGFFHCESWIEALRAAYSLKLEVATLHQQGDLCAAAVFARKKGLHSTRLVALPFSDAAEPLASNDQSRADFMRALIESNPRASIEVRGVAGAGRWRNLDCFAQWSLDLGRPFSEINAAFSRTVRSGIKRALKEDVHIDCGSDASYVARFFDLQLVTRRRQGVPPQPFNLFSSVHDKFSRGGDIEIWLVTFQGRDQAGLVLLRAGDQLCYKWAARIEDGHPGANHLLVARMIEAHAGKAAAIDFGRCDTRNTGLVRSKADLGCIARPLPYAFFPKAPRHISSEVLSGPAKVLSSIWKRLPLPVTRVLGEILYRSMA
jgi:Acetyltransferase (GNAT) domain